MNPGLDSRWKFSNGHKDYDFTIVGIWGRGFKDNYQVNTYEVLADDKEIRQMLSAERMEELIKKGNIKPL